MPGPTREDYPGPRPAKRQAGARSIPTKLEETVTAYLDVTVAFPLMVAYVRQTTRPKKQKRLYQRGAELHEKLMKSYLENNREVEQLKRLIKKLSA